MESDLSVVDDARERGLLVKQADQDVELEEDLAEDRRLDIMCQDLVLQALSCSLEKRFAKFEMCREIILEVMAKLLRTREEEEGDDQQIKDVVEKPKGGGIERGEESDETPNVGLKRKWNARSEATEKPSQKMGRMAKEFSGERHSERRRSLRQRVVNNGCFGKSQAEKPVCKKAMSSDSEVSSMVKIDVNHNTELCGVIMGSKSRECSGHTQTLKSPYQIQCPACPRISADATQFQEHVDSDHEVRVGRLRTATKCCCKLHSHVCRAFAGCQKGKKITRGVGGVSRPGTPEEKCARAALSRHQLLMDMNHNLLCALCIKFTISYLVEYDGGVVAEKGDGDKNGFEVAGGDCQKERQGQKSRKNSWELGRALNVRVERLTDKDLKSWRVCEENALVPSLSESDQKLSDPHTYHEESRGGNCEDDANEGGQRLRQLLSMEANLRRLLDQGDLEPEEREALDRLNMLIQDW